MQQHTKVHDSEISTSLIRQALNSRIKALLPGDTLRFASGSLAIGRIHSVSITLVPSRNYVWVVSGSADKTEHNLNRFTGIASDVVPSFDLPFIIEQDAMCDWRTYYEIMKQLHSNEPKMKTQQYISNLVRSAVPTQINILDFEFRVTEELFGKNDDKWYAMIRKLALIVALLDAKINYTIPKETYLMKQGPKVASETLTNLRTDLIVILNSIK